MRRALAKRLIPLLMVLVLVIPYFAVSYYDVYGHSEKPSEESIHRTSAPASTSSGTRSA